MQEAIELQKKLLKRISIMVDYIPDLPANISKHHVHSAEIIKNLCEGAEAISIVATMEIPS